MDEYLLVALVMVVDAWVAYTICARARHETGRRIQVTVVAGVAVSSLLIAIVLGIDQFWGMSALVSAVNGLTLVCGSWAVMKRLDRTAVRANALGRASDVVRNSLTFLVGGMIGFALGACGFPLWMLLGPKPG